MKKNTEAIPLVGGLIVGISFLFVSVAGMIMSGTYRKEARLVEAGDAEERDPAILAHVNGIAKAGDVASSGVAILGVGAGYSVFWALSMLLRILDIVTGSEQRPTTGR